MDNAFLKKLQEWKNQTFLSKMRNQSSEFFERLERSAGNCIFIRLEKMAFVRKKEFNGFYSIYFLPLLSKGRSVTLKGWRKKDKFSKKEEFLKK